MTVEERIKERKEETKKSKILEVKTKIINLKVGDKNLNKEGRS